jgi:S1-C subfamily serine protease
MQRIWILLGLALLFVGMGVTGITHLDERLRRLDELSTRLPEGIHTLSAELQHARSEVDSLHERLGRTEALTTDTNGNLRTELARLANDLRAKQDALLAELEEQECELQRLESWSESMGDEFQDARAMEARLASDQRWEGIAREVESTSDLARKVQAELERVSDRFQRDEGVMWNELVGPTVQLSGSSTVGSGVILRAVPESGATRPLVVTAWHVVRDIYAESSEPEPPVPVAIYDTDGTIRKETAALRAHDPGLDVALLELDSDEPVASTAVLASRELLASAHTFQEIYAVGCPLGNDPIPTRGEISQTRHEVDGSTYWMISAPTYIGNSGGGIFDARTRQLMGIFSKIYTHGSLRPTVVPHMGLVTSMLRIYAWVEGGDFARLVPLGDAHGSMTIVLTRTPSDATAAK